MLRRKIEKTKMGSWGNTEKKIPEVEHQKPKAISPQLTQTRQKQRMSKDLKRREYSSLDAAKKTQIEINTQCDLIKIAPNRIIKAWPDQEGYTAVIGLTFTRVLLLQSLFCSFSRTYLSHMLPGVTLIFRESAPEGEPHQTHSLCCGPGLQINTSKYKRFPPRKI